MGSQYRYTYGRGRRSEPSKEMQALADSNADLKAANHLQEQRIKFLPVTVTVVLASTGGLGMGLATCLAGASVQIALSSSFAGFLGVIMASMAILSYMHR